MSTYSKLFAAVMVIGALASSVHADAVAPGMAEYRWDVEFTRLAIEANEVALIQVKSTAGVITSYTQAIFFSTVCDCRNSAGEFVTGDYITGTAFVDISEFIDGDLTLEYQTVGHEKVSVPIVPEPASLSLLALGGLDLLRGKK